MKKPAILLLLAFTINACQQQNTSNTAATENAQVDPAIAPVFSFEKETYDFGEITEGEQVSYDFTFTNTGKSPLIISSASATCGCTVPEYPNQPIAPGEKGTIHVVFNSTGKSGMQNKVVTLTANTATGSHELHVVGNVKPKTNP